MLERIRRMGGATVIAVLGGLLITLPFFSGLDGIADDFERLIPDVAPVFEPPQFEDARNDLTRLNGITAEFIDGVIPALTLPLLSSEERIVASFDEAYPAVMQGIRALPGIADHFIPMLDAAIGQRANLNAAAEIVTPGIPATSATPALIGAGVVALVGAGVVALGWVRSGALMVLFLGGVLVAAPLMTGLGEKAAAAADLDTALAPIVIPETAAAARESMAVAEAMGEQFWVEMLPDLARRIPLVTEAGLLGIVETSFPAIARGLATMDEQLARFDALVTVLERNLEPYRTIHGTDLAPVIAWVIVLGGCLAAVGIIALMPIRTAGRGGSREGPKESVDG